MKSNRHVKLIGAEGQRHLMSLVEKTAELVSDGSTPTDALVKVAGEMSSPPEFVIRAAEAFNGAAHLSHFKKASEETRGDSFHLADPAEALGRLFDEATQKVAASMIIPSRDLFEPEVDSFFDVTPIEEDSLEDLYKESSEANPSPKDSFDKILRECRRLESLEKKSVNVCKSLYDDALSEFHYNVGKVKQRFRDTDEVMTVKWASHSASWFGKESVEAISFSTGLDPSNIEVKSAEDRGVVHRTDIEQVSLLEDVVKSSKVAQEMHQKLAEAESEAYINKIQRDAALDEYLFGSEKQSAGIYGLTGSSINDMIDFTVGAPTTKGDRSSIDKDMKTELTNPFFRAQNDAISKAVNLKELMVMDPVVSTYHPDEVLSAMADIDIMAPNAANYPPFLRAMLRERLASGASMRTYDTKSFMETDDILSKRDPLNKGEGKTEDSKDSK